MQPPSSFLTAMEDYVRDSPGASTVCNDQVGYDMGLDAFSSVKFIDFSPNI